MSQAGDISATAGPVPPTVPTSFVTDSGTAVPALNVLNVVTPGSGTEGIMTLGSGNTVTVELTDVFFGTATTSDGAGQTQTLITIPMSANTVMSIEAIISGFESTLPGGVGSSLAATFIRSGAGVPAIIQEADDFVNVSSGLSSATYDISGSGANVIITVTGQATKTIDWRGRAQIVTAP